MSKIKSVLILLMGASLSGCSAIGGNWVAIHTYDKVAPKPDSANVVSTDVKQRSIIFLAREKAKQSGGSEDHDPVLQYCAEPPPDALTAQSVSASADLAAQLSKTADQSLRLQAALAASETAASITRTQTVNLLRESMYRTCERYVNGAISKAELSIQAARDQRLATAVLAIEQLTSTVKPSPTLIAGGAASANTGSAALQDKAIALAQDVATKRAKAKGAEDAYVALNTGAPTCDAQLQGAAPTKSDTDAEKATLAAYDKCNSAQTDVRTSALALAQAIEARDSAERMAASGAPLTATVQSQAQTDGGKGADGTASDRATVAKVVEDIVALTFQENDLKFGCSYVLFGANPKDVSKQVLDLCTTMGINSLLISVEDANSKSSGCSACEGVEGTKPVKLQDKLTGLSKAKPKAKLTTNGKPVASSANPENASALAVEEPAKAKKKPSDVRSAILDSLRAQAKSVASDSPQSQPQPGTTEQPKN